MDRNSDVSESNLKHETSISYLSWRYGANEDWKNYENFLNNYNWIDETRNMDINDKLNISMRLLKKLLRMYLIILPRKMAQKEKFLRR